jgi:esterase FrsA
MRITLGAIAALVPVSAALVWASSPFAQPAPTQAQALQDLRKDVQGRADHQAYPITGIDRNDVRKVLAQLKSTDPEEWAAVWAAMGEHHADVARQAADKGQQRDNWRQAWLDYHFGAWPAQDTRGKQVDYDKAIAAFREYAKLLDPPAEVVRIPFEGKEIVGYLRLPPGEGKKPVVLTIGGLDEYKEFGVEHDSGLFVKAGLGVLALDMPGTGQSPVKMEVGSEREIGAALDWLGKEPRVDPQRLAVDGASAGGYWAALSGYVDRAKIKAVVAQGAPVNEYFQADWQHKSWDTSEYLFGLKEARMFVYGFKPGQDDAFLAKMGTFSLETRGILKGPSAPMLVVNGEKDTQVPIADLYLLLKTGSPKFAWVNPEGGHTGRSKEWPQERIASEVVAPWLAAMLAEPMASQ